MKRIVVLVSNDLVHDQRVRKVCDTLQALHYDITLVGRRLSSSETLVRPYQTKRFKLLFTQGALFYAALNFRLFFFLLFHKCDVILANDLDTLLPAFLVSKLRRKALVYDSHEYFTESAGLTGRAFQKKAWTVIEEFIFPKLEHVITVNKSIAGFYEDKYGIDVKVVRNIPPKRKLAKSTTRKDLCLPEDKKIVLLQGAYIDIDRGAKEAALAMEFTEGILLLVIGAGQELEEVKRIRVDKKLEDKILVLPKLPFDELMQYTLNADLGLSIDKPLHLNYKYSLPNKLFDYIQCSVPVLTSALPELLRVHEAYNIGLCIDSHEPRHIAEKMKEGVESEDRTLWLQELQKAAEEYTWENESLVLQHLYANL